MMSSRVYYQYTIRDRDTNKILFKGSCGKCAEFLGCGNGTVISLAKRCWASEQGFFNSRYIVTRKAGKSPSLKHYKVFKDGKLVVQGLSKTCAKRLGIDISKWYQFVHKCSMQDNPEYVITSEAR